MRLFDLSLTLNGYPISKAKETLNHIQKLTPEEKVKDILERRNSIVDYHTQHNAFYGDRFIEHYQGDWESVPVMTKRDLQVPLHQRLSRGYDKSKVYVNKTSGSSGDPFIFAKDKWCHAMTWAQIMDRFNWYGLDFNQSIQARFYGTPLDPIGYRKERLKDWLTHRYRFSVFDLSDRAFDTVLNKFENQKFSFINGYTSPIVQFAKYLDRKGLILKDICNSLKVCIVTSEMLFDDDRALMEQSFGVPIVNEYGASELDLIAFETPNQDWLLNSDTLYIEILDGDNKEVPHGTEGRVVITSLFNKAHPFIRYDIGDRGIKDEKSTLTTPILKHLIGRSDDLVKLPSGKTAAGLTFYYITKSVIEKDGLVKEFVIEQTALSKFIIYYIADSDIGKEQKKLIRSEINKYLEPGLEIQMKRKTFLKRSERGKLKQFISTI